jgi:hypothetical protein
MAELLVAQQRFADSPAQSISHQLDISKSAR